MLLFSLILSQSIDGICIKLFGELIGGNPVIVPLANGLGSGHCFAHASCGFFAALSFVGQDFIALGQSNLLFLLDVSLQLLVKDSSR
jgi:hypothetical protein